MKISPCQSQVTSLPTQIGIQKTPQNTDTVSGINLAVYRLVYGHVTTEDMNYKPTEVSIGLIWCAGSKVSSHLRPGNFSHIEILYLSLE